MTEQQLKEFEAIARPVIEWLNNNCHPHATVVIDCASAELLEGICMIKTNEYLRD